VLNFNQIEFSILISPNLKLTNPTCTASSKAVKIRSIDLAITESRSKLVFLGIGPHNETLLEPTKKYMKKILIIGNCGVGKTTFSRKLAKKISLPLIHLDQHYWKPSWEKPTTVEWRTTVSNLIQGNEWIMEGNYKSSFDIRIPAADTIIFLDYPRTLALWRALKRFVQSIGKQRPDIGGNNIEKIDLPFLKWIMTYPREQILSEIEKYRDHQKLIIVQSPKALDDFIKNIS
jgi:adenylate kinase family enzyme